MDLFTNYENLSTSYTPYNLTKFVPDFERTSLPLEEYNAKGELIGYSWHYGDSIVLEFNTSGKVTYDNQTYMSASTFLQGKEMLLQMFNFRGECVYCQKIDASTTVKYLLDSKNFGHVPKGVYRCNLTLLGDDDFAYVLVNKEDYIFMIQ